MTTTVFEGMTAYAHLCEGQQVVVTVPADGAAFVDRLIADQKLDATDISASASSTFGPYAVPMTLRISCSAGSCTFTQADATDALSGGGGGAGSFTELADAPMSITPTGIVIGNDDGTALRMSDIISINENGVFQIVENGDSGIAVTASGAGGFSVAADGTGGISLLARGVGGGMSLSGGENLLLSAISTNAENAQGVGIVADIGGVDIRTSGGGGIMIRVASGSGQVRMPSLPTSDPAVAGALWNNAGTLKISAG